MSESFFIPLDPIITKPCASGKVTIYKATTPQTRARDSGNGVFWNGAVQWINVGGRSMHIFPCWDWVPSRNEDASSAGMLWGEEDQILWGVERTFAICIWPRYMMLPTAQFNIYETGTDHPKWSAGDIEWTSTRFSLHFLKWKWLGDLDPPGLENSGFSIPSPRQGIFWQRIRVSW